MKDREGNYYTMYLQHWYKFDTNGDIWHCEKPDGIDLPWEKVAHIDPPQESAPEEKK